VVAEGVETEGQLSRLRAMACDYGQGFLLCQALDADKIEHLLDQAGPWDCGEIEKTGAAVRQPAV